jgi:uncharacterized hydrophobic protein (TIGR00271 family)
VLHLRVITPETMTDQVLTILRKEPGATHVLMLAGVVIEPPGDLVEADIARESADGVIAALCDLGIDRDGGITVQPLDAALSDAAVRAEEAAPGDPADAVVWQELLARTGEESRLNATFLAFLSIACLLAAVGVITDSAITIVGAMVVGPEFGPLAAIAVGLVRRRWDLVRRASAAIGLGFPLAIGITALGAALGSWANLFEASVIKGEHEVDFVYQVGWWSFIVAVLAGAAGMLSMTSAKSAVLVGVFISVTTVPAAGYAAVAAILGEWSRFFGSIGQLVVNMIGIVLAAGVVLLLRKGSWRSADPGRPLSTG